jgi:hypothetical protein
MNNSAYTELPKKSKDCAILIPLYKSEYSDSEMLCIKSAMEKLSKWDIFFVTHPYNVNQPFEIDQTLIRYSLFGERHFHSVNSYSSWLLTSELYLRFQAYKKILICQTDAYVIVDDISYWVVKDYDYIGAPWHGLISITPNYNATPHLNGTQFKLFVGNGGFSMRDPAGVANALIRNCELSQEFRGNEDGFFAFLGLLDPLFKVAPYHDACIFALELQARETLRQTKRMPMGFHALEKNDIALWRELTVKM